MSRLPELVRYVSKQVAKQRKEHQISGAPIFRDAIKTARSQVEELLTGIKDSQQKEGQLLEQIASTRQQRTEVSQQIVESRKTASQLPALATAQARTHRALRAAKIRLSTAATPQERTKYKQQVGRIEERFGDIRIQVQEAKEAQQQLISHQIERKRLQSELVHTRQEYATQQTETKRMQGLEPIARQRIEDKELQASIAGAFSMGAQRIFSGLRSGGFSGIGSAVQGIGEVAGAIPGAGPVVGGFIQFTGAILKSVDALNRWTREVQDSQLALGGPMMALAAEKNVAEKLKKLVLSFQLEPSARRLEETRREFDKNVGMPAEGWWEEIKNDFLTGIYAAPAALTSAEGIKTVIKETLQGALAAGATGTVLGGAFGGPPGAVMAGTTFTIGGAGGGFFRGLSNAAAKRKPEDLETFTRGMMDRVNKAQKEWEAQRRQQGVPSMSTSTLSPSPNLRDVQVPNRFRR